MSAYSTQQAFLFQEPLVLVLSCTHCAHDGVPSPFALRVFLYCGFALYSRIAAFDDDHTLIAGVCFIVAAVVLGMGVANRAACRLQVKACQVIIPRDVIALKRAKEVVIVWA